VSFLEQLNNIYAIDTRMFGFDRYMSAYIVEGREIALVDTGLPNQFEAVRAGIRARGFSLSHISYIFVTHAHPDHSGSVAPLLRESPTAKVYIHPSGVKYLIDPSIEASRRKGVIPPEVIARLGVIEPVPSSRVQELHDSEVFDLGNGEKLKIIFAPGHLQSGIVLWEEKNKGLFINDLVGIYLADADAHYPICPPGSDHQMAIKSLQKLMDLPLEYLYLGHYGIVDNPKQLMTRSINNMQQLLDVGLRYMSEGKPEMVAGEVYKMILPELEKLRLVRGEALYQYASKEHVPSQAEIFAGYCRKKLTEH
jgi:glyoxylase-like metal-dependent hydrolase (beta-lactamase superfamily II)